MGSQLLSKLEETADDALGFGKIFALGFGQNVQKLQMALWTSIVLMVFILIALAGIAVLLWRILSILEFVFSAYKREMKRPKQK